VKHKLKLFLRQAYAQVLFHTGLHLLVDALMPRRLTILAGHCVSAPSNAGLSKDMKIASEKLEHILAWLDAHYEMTTVGGGFERLRQPGSKSLAALSMDDGYRDNRSHLLPLLVKVGVPATIYLESRPLDEHRVNWSHKYFWILDRIGAEEFVERFTKICVDARTNELLAKLARKKSYDVKRVLKYEAPTAERSRAIDALFAELGGDERKLCDDLYMTWDDARALSEAGVEIGGHTVNHEILSRLDRAGAEREVSGSREALKRELAIDSASFAYPFGRRWDFNADVEEAVRASGFANAATTHAGTNRPTTNPYELKRIMIDEDADLALIAAEACGGFDLLRKIGIHLAE
jgi:peptidoglycan/xylan/chitin deacetylase (PgdA/CDA1 family)